MKKISVPRSLLTFAVCAWGCLLAARVYSQNTFEFTGVEQTYTVPEGVTLLSFDVVGATGQNTQNPVTMSAEPAEFYSGPDGTTYSHGFGGRGARVTGLIAVLPNQVVSIYVGGTNAFNGGGAGGQSSAQYRGGAGGGASDIRIGGDAASNRIVVAGGGGGAAGGYRLDYPTGVFPSFGTYYGTGYGGGPAALNGSRGGGYWSTGNPGEGGTQDAGGSGGTPPRPSQPSYGAGAGGVSGQGGVGGSDNYPYAGCGGGGGGWIFWWWRRLFRFFLHKR